MNPVQEPMRLLRWHRALMAIMAVAVPAVVVVISQKQFGFPVVAGLLGCAVLPMRHRWPQSTLLLCLPGVAGGLGWPPVIVATFALGRTEPNLRRFALWISLLAVSAVTPVFVTETLRPADYVLTVAFVLFIAIIPMALGGLVATRQQLRESLTRLREATEAELFAKGETARAEERSRITREIHDAVGHHVTLIAVEAAALSATTSDPAVLEAAKRMRGLAKEAITEMRTTLGLAGEHPEQPVSVRMIPDLIARAREAGVEVALFDDLDTSAEIAPGVSRAAYRVVQEALTNVSKHAPGADVTVRLRGGQGTLRISVDNGAPVGQVVDIGRGGSGLEGLSERVQMAGGRLEAGPSEDGGFQLLAVLPQEQHEQGARDLA